MEDIQLKFFKYLKIVVIIIFCIGLGIGINYGIIPSLKTNNNHDAGNQNNTITINSTDSNNVSTSTHSYFLSNPIPPLTIYTKKTNFRRSLFEYNGSNDQNFMLLSMIKEFSIIPMLGYDPLTLYGNFAFNCPTLNDNMFLNLLNFENCSPILPPVALLTQGRSTIQPIVSVQSPSKEIKYSKKPYTADIDIEFFNNYSYDFSSPICSSPYCFMNEFYNGLITIDNNSNNMFNLNGDLFFECINSSSIKSLVYLLENQLFDQFLNGLSSFECIPQQF